jgi:hypothetical protein
MAPRFLKGPEIALIQLPEVKVFLLTITVLWAIAFLIVLRASTTTSTIAAGLAPVMAMAILAAMLMPIVNDLASTRPLVASLEKQQVAPEQITLYAAPYLWTRDFPIKFQRVVYGAPALATKPVIIVTARAHASEIAPSLTGYHVVDSMRMIGKWFDVYRR